MTKLFQSQDYNLRRMMYIFIKEVAETCDPDDVIIGESIYVLFMYHAICKVYPRFCGDTAGFKIGQSH